MRNRKWQRILSWVLTMTMLFGTFQGTGFSVYAVDDTEYVYQSADDEDAEVTDQEEAATEEEFNEVDDASGSDTDSDADIEDADDSSDADDADTEDSSDDAEEAEAADSSDEAEETEDAEEAEEADEAEEAVEAEDEDIIEAAEEEPEEEAEVEIVGEPQLMPLMLVSENLSGDASVSTDQFITGSGNTDRLWITIPKQSTASLDYFAKYGSGPAEICRYVGSEEGDAVHPEEMRWYISYDEQLSNALVSYNLAVHGSASSNVLETNNGAGRRLLVKTDGLDVGIYGITVSCSFVNESYIGDTGTYYIKIKVVDHIATEIVSDNVVGAAVLDKDDDHDLILNLVSENYATFDLNVTNGKDGMSFELGAGATAAKASIVSENGNKRTISINTAEISAGVEDFEVIADADGIGPWYQPLAYSVRVIKRANTKIDAVEAADVTGDAAYFGDGAGTEADPYNVYVVTGTKANINLSVNGGTASTSWNMDVTSDGVDGEAISFNNAKRSVSGANAVVSINKLGYYETAANYNVYTVKITADKDGNNVSTSVNNLTNPENVYIKVTVIEYQEKTLSFNFVGRDGKVATGTTHVDTAFKTGMLDAGYVQYSVSEMSASGNWVVPTSVSVNLYTTDNSGNPVSKIDSFNGLKATYDEKTGIFTISGNATKYIKETSKYLIVAKRTSGTLTGNRDKQTQKVNITYDFLSAEDQQKVSVHVDTKNRFIAADIPGNKLPFDTTTDGLSFGKVSANYTIGNGTGNTVVGKNLKLFLDGITGKDRLTGVEFYLANDTANPTLGLGLSKNFELQDEKIGTIAKGKYSSIATIVPVLGLPYTKSEQYYSVKLMVSANEFEKPYEVGTFTFEVDPDLSVFVNNKETSAVSETIGSIDYSYYYLGEFAPATKIDPVTVVVKSSQNTTGCSLSIDEAVRSVFNEQLKITATSETEKYFKLSGSFLQRAWDPGEGITYNSDEKSFVSLYEAEEGVRRYVFKLNVAGFTASDEGASIWCAFDIKQTPVNWSATASGNTIGVQNGQNYTWYSTSENSSMDDTLELEFTNPGTEPIDVFITADYSNMPYYEGSTYGYVIAPRISTISGNETIEPLPYLTTYEGEQSYSVDLHGCISWNVVIPAKKDVILTIAPPDQSAYIALHEAFGGIEIPDDTSFWMTVSINGGNTKSSEVGFEKKTISLNYVVSSDTAARIVSPAPGGEDIEHAYNLGEYAVNEEIETILFGSNKTKNNNWQIVTDLAEGEDVDPADNIGGTGEAAKVGVSVNGDGLREFGLEFDSTSHTITGIPTKTGVLAFKVTPNEGGQGTWFYLTINNSKDLAFEFKDGETTLGGDVKLEVSTSTITEETKTVEVTVKNNTSADMTNVKVELTGVTNDIVSLAEADKKIAALGEGEEATVTLTIAKGSEKDAGVYGAELKVVYEGEGVGKVGAVSQNFAIEVTVEDAPIIADAETIGDKTYDGFKVGVPVDGIQLTARTKANKDTIPYKYINAGTLTWTWEPVKGASSASDNGFILSERGVISGTPEVAGTYKMSVSVSYTYGDVTVAGKPVIITLKVTGSGAFKVTASENGVNAAIPAARYADGVFVFPGAKEGYKELPKALEVSISNNNANTVIENVYVETSEDDDCYDVTISANTLSAEGVKKNVGDIIPTLSGNETISINVVPKDNCEAGTHRAVISIKSDSVPTETIVVYFSVAAPLTADEYFLEGTVGKKFEEAISFSGADVNEEMGQKNTYSFVSGSDDYSAHGGLRVEESSVYYLMADTANHGNTLSSAVTGFTKAGLVKMVISVNAAKVDANASAGQYYDLPSDYATVSVNLNIEGTDDIYITRGTDTNKGTPDTWSRIKGDGSVDQVKEFVFEERTEGHAIDAPVVFNVENATTVELEKVYYSIQDKSGKENTDFVIVDKPQVDSADFANGSNLAAGKSIVIKVQTKENLPAKEDDYEAYLVISSDNIRKDTADDVTRVLLKFHVNEADYDCTVSANGIVYDEENDTLVFEPVMNRTPDAINLTLTNEGNTDVQYDVYELDESGVPIETADEMKVKIGSENSGVYASGKNSANALKIGTPKNIEISIRDAYTGVGVYSTRLRIRTQRGVNFLEPDPKEFILNLKWTVYDDEVEVKYDYLTDEKIVLADGGVDETYSGDVSKPVMITNVQESDPESAAYSVYGIAVSIDAATLKWYAEYEEDAAFVEEVSGPKGDYSKLSNMFYITTSANKAQWHVSANSPEYAPVNFYAQLPVSPYDDVEDADLPIEAYSLTDPLAQGESYIFNIHACPGLSLGTYIFDVVVSSNNAGEKRIPVSFTVNRAENYEVTLLSDSDEEDAYVTEEGDVADRLGTTLEVMSTVSNNGVSKEDGVYYMDLNDDEIDDVSVEVSTVKGIKYAVVTRLTDMSVSTNSAFLEVDEISKAILAKNLADNSRKHYYNGFILSFVNEVKFDAGAGLKDGDGFIGVSANEVKKNRFYTIQVKQGDLIGEVPSVSRNGYIFLGWVDNSDYSDFNPENKILGYTELGASWIVDNYPESNEDIFIEEDVEAGMVFTDESKLIEFHVMGNYPTYSGSYIRVILDTERNRGIDLKTDISHDAGLTANCYRPASFIYSASANAATDTEEYNYKFSWKVITEPMREHVYAVSMDSVKVVWSAEGEPYGEIVSANILKKCTYEDCYGDETTVKLQATSVSSDKTEPTCTASSNDIYYVTFTGDEVFGDEGLVMEFGPYHRKELGHVWAFDDVKFTEMNENGVYTKADVILKCTRPGCSANIVSSNVAVERISYDPESDTTPYLVHIGDGVSYNAPNYNKTGWNSEFIYNGSVSTNDLDVSANFTPKAAPDAESWTFPASFTSEDDPEVLELVTITSTVSGPDAKTVSESVIFNKVTGEKVEGAHSWSFVGYDWTGSTSANAFATASFNCTNHSNETRVLNAEMSSKIEMVNYIIWTASLNEAGKTESKIYDINTGEEVDHIHNWTAPEWHWSSESDNFAGTYVTFTCDVKDCKDNVKVVSDNSIGREKVTIVSENTVSMGCITNSEYTWTASVSLDGIEKPFVDVKVITKEDATDHDWAWLDDSMVIKDGNELSAVIDLECQHEWHEGDRIRKLKAAFVSKNEVAAACEQPGSITYYADFYEYDENNAIITDTHHRAVKTVSVNSMQHDYELVVEWTENDFPAAPSVNKATLVCTRDPEHTVTVDPKNVSVNETVSTTPNITREFEAFYYYGAYDRTYKTFVTTYSHKEHEWTVSFNWINVSANYADTVVTATATCIVEKGGEKVELPVELVRKEAANDKIEYTAKAYDGNGKKHIDKVYIDKDGSVKEGAAGTPTVKGGDIIIEGLEETYEFTGAKIKPAITIVDGDVILAETTDYTYKVEGKNKIGEINTVKITGKGNYEGKSAEATFKIVSPLDALIEAGKTPAGPVKKVELSDKNFVYDGTAKYPKTVTVTLKDGGSIVYTYDGNGDYTTDSDKEVGISICNNINKGTATIGAMGAGDTKPKKATFKIAQADINQAEFEISSVAWGVKAQPAEITATYNGIELVQGQDFKVTFKAPNAGENAGTAKITGKGNFKGKIESKAYTVDVLEIAEENIVVTAFEGQKAGKVKVQVVDNAGNALKKNAYSYVIKDAATGKEFGKDEVISKEIEVVVNASGNAEADDVSVTVSAGKNIAKVKGAFKVNNSTFFKKYTGEEITLDGDDFVITNIDTKNLAYDTDFVIVGYKNNVKKGSMTVTVQGIGEYGGTKTFKVKIKAKNITEVNK